MGRGSSRGSCGIPTSRPFDREVVAKREALQQPNMRLKLTGAHQWGRIALPRRLAFLSAPQTPCARRALRPAA